MTNYNLESPSSLADFELLAEVSQLLTVTDLDGVLQRVIDLAARAVGAAKVSLFLQDEGSNSWLRLLTSRQLDPLESLQVVKSVIDKGLAGWVMQNKQGALVRDTETDDRWHVFPDDTLVVRSVLCIPLIQNDEVSAVITLSHPEPNHFNDHHLRLMTIIANQMMIAVRNAQLFDRMLMQQQQLEAIIHAIPDVLLVVNEQSRVILVNHSALALFDTLTHNVLIGLDLADVASIDSAFAPLLELNTHSPGEGPWMFNARSNRYRQDLIVTVAPWADEFGRNAGHIILMHDVTTLRDLNRFKSEMLKMASHDLRSPLGLIVGYCDLIEMDAEPESPLTDYIDVIRRSTRRMNNLLDDLLRVEEIRNSPDELMVPTQFGDLVAKVVESGRMLTAAKHQEFIADIELDNLPPIYMDPVLIREAMENLVSNAAKYTPEEGRVLIQAFYDERRVHFIVEDNGVGILESEVERIFNWGYRAKKHTNSTIEGTGLGLALVKSVVERHRGEVWAQSEEGVGSRFVLWLPR